jgi:hypothetical protein
MMVMRLGGKIMIGLTRGNIERLTAGDPIQFAGGPVWELREVAIMFGETKPDILKQLEAAGVEVLDVHRRAAEADPL